MNPDQIGKIIQNGNAENQTVAIQRRDAKASVIFRGRFKAERLREQRELKRQMDDWGV